MIIHSLSSEAVLRAIARKIGEDENKYGLAGLLHDIDVEVTNADPRIHGQKSIELLQPACIDAEINGEPSYSPSEVRYPGLPLAGRQR